MDYLPLILMALLFCYFYILMAQFFTHRKCNYINETAVAILIGALFGFIIILIKPEFLIDSSYEKQFRDVILLVLLPPMLFEDGYNVPKRKFFHNFFYINLYGILGSIFNFAVIFGVIYAFNAYKILTTIDNISLDLQFWHIFAFASLMCSIDTVVPEKIVNPERYPKLFSIIFGESIFKDTIAVTLFDTFTDFIKQKGGSKEEIQTARNVGIMTGLFFKAFFCSILIGMVVGIFTTILFKHMRFLLADKGVAEVPLIMITGYSAYILSEWASCSGVISMLFCGITLSHFNVYNLSAEGAMCSKNTVSMLALVAESLLFFALGFMMFDVQMSQGEDSAVLYSFSWNFLLIALLAILLGRLVNIYLASLIGYLFVGKKTWRLHRYELQILFVSGLVKGAVPFALILSMPFPYTLASSSIQNTTILVVFLTSLIFNSIMPKFLRHRLLKIRELILQNDLQPNLFDSLLFSYGANNNLMLERESKGEEGEQVRFLNKMKYRTQKYWKRIEEGFLKPLLIFDYHSRKDQIKKLKIQKRKEEAEDYWRRYFSESFLGSEAQLENTFLDLQLIDDDVKVQSEQEEQQLEARFSLGAQATDKQLRSMTNYKLNQSETVNEALKVHSKSEIIEMISVIPQSPREEEEVADVKQGKEMVLRALREDLLEKRQFRERGKGQQRE